MDLLNGYVRLHRRLLQNPIWTQLTPAVLKVAVYFLLRANYKSVEWYDGARTETIPAGSFVTSYASAAAACSLSVQQVRDAFAHLKRTHFATYRRTPRWTLVTVVNWATYQTTANDENTPENTDRNSCGNRQGTTDKEIKKLRTNTCASGDAQFDDLPPIDDPPLRTTEPGALFAVEPISQQGPEPEAVQLSWFQRWWAIYWRKRDRKKAWLAFKRHVRTQARFEQVMKATKAQASEMFGKEEKYRPHGATWLNGERWDDETEKAPLRPSQAVDEYPELPGTYEAGGGMIDPLAARGLPCNIDAERFVLGSISLDGEQQFAGRRNARFPGFQPGETSADFLSGWGTCTGAVSRLIASRSLTSWTATKKRSPAMGSVT